MAFLYPEWWGVWKFVIQCHACSGSACNLSIVIPWEAIHVTVSSQRSSPTQETNEPTFMVRNFLWLTVCPTPVCLHLLLEGLHLISLYFLQSVLNWTRHQHPRFSFLVLTPTHTFLYFLLYHLEAELSQQKQSFSSAPHLVEFAAQLMEASVWEWLAWAAKHLGSSCKEDEKFA